VCKTGVLVVLQTIRLEVTVLQRFVIYWVPPTVWVSCSHSGCWCLCCYI